MLSKYTTPGTIIMAMTAVCLFSLNVLWNDVVLGVYEQLVRLYYWCMHTLVFEGVSYWCWMPCGCAFMFVECIMERRCVTRAPTEGTFVLY